MRPEEKEQIYNVWMGTSEFLASNNAEHDGYDCWHLETYSVRGSFIVLLKDGNVVGHNIFWSPKKGEVVASKLSALKVKLEERIAELKRQLRHRQTYEQKALLDDYQNKVKNSIPLQVLEKAILPEQEEFMLEDMAMKAVIDDLKQKTPITRSKSYWVTPDASEWAYKRLVEKCHLIGGVRDLDHWNEIWSEGYNTRELVITKSDFKMYFIIILFNDSLFSLLDFDDSKMIRTIVDRFSKIGLRELNSRHQLKDHWAKSIIDIKGNKNPYPKLFNELKFDAEKIAK